MIDARWGGRIVILIGGTLGAVVAPCALAQDDATPAAESAEPAPDEPSVEITHQEGWGDLTRFTAFWENDGAYVKPRSNSDEHYTNGIKLDFAWNPEWAQDWLEWMPLSSQFGDDPHTAFGLSVAQLMFTPKDLSEREVIKDDRPYAGWLAFSAYWQRAGQLNDHLAMFDHIEVDAGVVGEYSGAQAAQEFVHSAVPGQTEPEGWPNQISNTPAIDLTLRRKWRFSTTPNADNVSLQLIPSVGGTLGTVYRQLDADVTVRIGWNLPDDFGPTRLADVNAATGGWSSDFGFYVFGRFGGRAVQHNIFLDGSDFKRSPHTVESEPLVGELQVGMVVLLWKHFELGYSQTFETDEFEGQKDYDSYGALSLGYRTTF